jgi:hypothetical protein
MSKEYRQFRRCLRWGFYISSVLLFLLVLSWRQDSSEFATETGLGGGEQTRLIVGSNRGQIFAGFVTLYPIPDEPPRRAFGSERFKAASWYTGQLQAMFEMCQWRAGSFGIGSYAIPDGYHRGVYLPHWALAGLVLLPMAVHVTWRLRRLWRATPDKATSLRLTTSGRGQTDER